MNENKHSTAPSDLAAGTRGSFELAYAAMAQAARTAARCTDPNDADDIVAETMSRAFVRWERLTEHPNPAGWAYRCAQFVCREFQRRGHILDENTAADSEAATNEPTIDDTVAERVAIHSALAALSPRQRQVVTLRYLHDYSEADTAQRLGLSPANVRAAAHEARSRLRTVLVVAPDDQDRAA